MLPFNLSSFVTLALCLCRFINCFVPSPFPFCCSAGGPSFYINTVDNTQSHGPGGQPTDDDFGEGEAPADPCFGRVVSGYEVVARIQQQALSGGDNAAGQLNHFVTILDAVVVRYTKPNFNPGDLARGGPGAL
jgi:hypothetical protein